MRTYIDKYRFVSQLVHTMCPRGVDDPECPKVLFLWFSKCPMTGCYGTGSFDDFPHLIDGQFLLDLMTRTKSPVVPALWTLKDNMASPIGIFIYFHAAWSTSATRVLHLDAGDSHSRSCSHL